MSKTYPTFTIDVQETSLQGSKLKGSNKVILDLLSTVIKDF